MIDTTAERVAPELDPPMKIFLGSSLGPSCCFEINYEASLQATSIKEKVTLKIYTPSLS